MLAGVFNLAPGATIVLLLISLLIITLVGKRALRHKGFKNQMADINIGIAFAAGFASFISPCCLPLYPSYLSIITGMSVNDLKNEQNRKEVRFRTMTHTLAFILGFSAVYYTLGWGGPVRGVLHGIPGPDSPVIRASDHRDGAYAYRHFPA